MEKPHLRTPFTSLHLSFGLTQTFFSDIGELFQKLSIYSLINVHAGFVPTGCLCTL